uniref:Uncharacterized protein n=1 Tax=Romanomermis culicivorax TaxID=13658 RepID=A0A915JP42_ROMCU
MAGRVLGIIIPCDHKENAIGLGDLGLGNLGGLGVQGALGVRTIWRSVHLEVTISRFSKNCGCPFRSKVDFQAERFKLLTIRSVPSKRPS